MARFQIAVVGGGPAGLATAIALLREGQSVIIIERSNYSSERVGEHLGPNSRPLLRTLGLLKIGDNHFQTSCPGIRSVWGANEPVHKDYVFHPHGEGLNVSRPEFDLRLASVASHLGANLITTSKVISITEASDAWCLTLAQGLNRLTFQADFVIDATGRSASIAKRLGAKPIVYDNLIGVVGRTAPSQVNDALVFIEAVQNGWWYSAGLPDGSVVAAFQTDPDLVDVSEGARQTTWREHIKNTKITATRSRGLLSIDSLRVRTARTQRLNRFADKGWLAVGDAAMSFDPLSSEGITKGLIWGKRAARIAVAYCKGDRFALRDYQRALEQTFAEYLLQRYRYYSAERRWKGSPFWARRHIAPTLSFKRG